MAKTPKALPPKQWLEPRVRISRIASLACFFGMTAFLSVYYLAIADLHGARPGVILAIELLPLLLLAPGVVRGRPRGLSWVCFVINLYFIKGALAAFDPNRWLFGVLEMLVSVAVFTSALLYVRWRSQLDRSSASQPPLRPEPTET